MNETFGMKDLLLSQKRAEFLLQEMLTLQAKSFAKERGLDEKAVIDDCLNSADANVKAYFAPQEEK